MGNRAQSIAFRTSVVILCFFFLLVLFGYVSNAWEHRLSLSRNFHIGVWNTGLDSRLVFFNDAEYGPYRGSIVGLAGSEYPHTSAFGDTFGVYYRHFTWPDSVLCLFPSWRLPSFLHSAFHFTVGYGWSGSAGRTLIAFTSFAHVAEAGMRFSGIMPSPPCRVTSRRFGSNHPINWPGSPARRESAEPFWPNRFLSW